MNKLLTRVGGPMLALAAITAGSSNASADSLLIIPTLGADTVNEGRAITPDGLYVVGNSGPAGTHGFFYNIGTATAYNVNSSDNAQSTAVTGIGYRYVSSQQQIVMSGLTGSGYADWMTTDGATFQVKRRDTLLGTSPWTIPAANGMAGTASDVFYGAFKDSANSLRVGQYSGAWPPAAGSPTTIIAAKSVPATAPASINGVSSTGRAVGFRQNASPDTTKNNYVMDFAGGGSGSVFFFNGLDGTTKGQAFSVSADGNTIFGQSPTILGGATTAYGYKATFSGQAEQSINPLPLFGGETGSTSLQVPYGCTADGRFAVGMDYRGTEKAVLWATGDINPANWAVIDLTDLALSEGILGGFNRLNRAYSVGQDGAGDLVITGTGSWSPDGGTTPYVTRAFVMTVVPEPTTISLLALGCLLVLRRRK